MIDGVKILCKGVTPEQWEQNPLLAFGMVVNPQTGEVLQATRKAERAGLRFEIRPSIVAPGQTHCLLYGSLQKHHNAGGNNAGGNNAGQYTFKSLCHTIAALQSSYNINPAAAQLQGLEIGVNIALPYSPQRVLKQVVCYKGKPFAPLVKHDKRAGLVCVLNDYEVKIYDKGRQAGKGRGYVLRLEYKATRQRSLIPYHLATLADITNPAKVYPLLALLAGMLNNIVFVDKAPPTASMKQKERERLLQYTRPEYWAGLQRIERKRHRERLDKLAGQYSKHHIKPLLAGLLVSTWNSLFAEYLEAAKVLRFPQLLPPLEAAKNVLRFPRLFTPFENGQNVTFSTLEYLLESVTYTPKKNSAKNAIKKCPKNGKNEGLKNWPKNAQDNTGPTPPRICQTCHRDISHQHPKSIFCSERLHGPAAKQCRNKDSNRRRDLKRILTKADKMSQQIAITYTANGNTYTDTLHPAELAPLKSWLDRIVKIEILHPPAPPQTIHGPAAANYITHIVNTENTNQ